MTIPIKKIWTTITRGVLITLGTIVNQLEPLLIIEFPCRLVKLTKSTHLGIKLFQQSNPSKK